MSIENVLWGAPRIHGGQTWSTFLRNHAPHIAATDLFVVPTIGFVQLYVNPQHISGLPAEVRNALAHMCRDSKSEHQFARYTQNLRSLVLHFEHFRCGDRGALCTQAGCLHQVYVSTGGHYRLLKSYYAPEGD
jgi:hypothetical protein